jgi:hypothetical protein
VIPSSAQTSSQNGTRRHIRGSLRTKLALLPNSDFSSALARCLKVLALGLRYQSMLNGCQSSHLLFALASSSSWKTMKATDSQ